MTNELFITLLSVAFGLLLGWGFKTLPQEGWQILATIPANKKEDGGWKGINLTYYGLFTSIAYVVAVATFILLCSTLKMPMLQVTLIVVIVLAVCVPASRLVAIIVERKQHTFTVAGAFFVGVIIMPLVVWASNQMFWGQSQGTVPVIPTLAAAAIAYTFGEGLGRLACISYGCCYGKCVHESHPLLQRIFQRWNFRFFGATRKIAYAGGMEGEAVIPVQGITAVLYLCSGLYAVLVYLNGSFFTALMLTLVVTQGWRLVSETMRADYRGGGKISAYQIMAVIAPFYVLGFGLLLDESFTGRVDLNAGIAAIWNPGMLLLLQSIGLILFLYTGRSTITGSEISFHVHTELT